MRKQSRNDGEIKGKPLGTIRKPLGIDGETKGEPRRNDGETKETKETMGNHRETIGNSLGYHAETKAQRWGNQVGALGSHGETIRNS